MSQRMSLFKIKPLERPVAGISNGDFSPWRHFDAQWPGPTTGALFAGTAYGFASGPAISRTRAITSMQERPLW
jgi:hypothetical protein